MGVRNNNPLLDSREYEVKCPDGATDTFTANLIAKNMMSQVDAEGYSYSIIYEIVDHRSYGNALSKDNAYISTKTRKPKLRQKLEVGTSKWSEKMVPHHVYL